MLDGELRRDEQGNHGAQQKPDNDPVQGRVFKYRSSGAFFRVSLIFVFLSGREVNSFSIVVWLLYSMHPSGIRFVGFDNFLNQRMAHHILFGKIDKANARHACQYPLCFNKSRSLARRQIGLGNIAGDDRF